MLKFFESFFGWNFFYIFHCFDPSILSFLIAACYHFNVYCYVIIKKKFSDWKSFNNKNIIITIIVCYIIVMIYRLFNISTLSVMALQFIAWLFNISTLSAMAWFGHLVVSLLCTFRLRASAAGVINFYICCQFCFSFLLSSCTLIVL